MSILMAPGLKITNRLVMPPMANAKSNEDGTTSQKLCDYYPEKSYGGYIGLIITEHSFINKEGKAREGQLSIDGNCDIVGLKALTDTIHQNRTKIFSQINHAGRATSSNITGHGLLSASSVPMLKAKNTEILPKEMDDKDI